jgi:hypothetical protein
MVSILEDVDVIVTPGGADDGAFTAGTPQTIKMDRVTMRSMRVLTDRSTAQDETPYNRLKKKDWEITCRTKLSRGSASTTLEGILKDNALVGVTVQERSGASGTFFEIDTGTGILGDTNIEWAGDECTIEFTIKPYGVALVFGHSS